MTRSHLDSIFSPYVLHSKYFPNPTIQALEVTIAIDVSARISDRELVKEKPKNNKQTKRPTFYDTDHGIQSVLRKGKKPETLIYLLGGTV